MILPGLRRPVGTIWCIGRNYAEHAKELGNEVPAAPIVFLKPASSLLLTQDPLPHIGDHAVAEHHKVEVVQHDPGVGQGEADPGGVGGARVDRDDLHRSTELWGL